MNEPEQNMNLGVPPPIDAAGGVVENIQESGWQKLLSGIRKHGTKLWALFSPFVIAILIYLYVDPFGAHESGVSADVPTAWSEAIGRLGMEPVYPPSEDISVGDILAVISGDELTDDQKDNPAIRQLLKRSIRLGHIELAESLRPRVGRRNFTITTPASCKQSQDGGKICDPPNAIALEPPTDAQSLRPVPEIDLAVVGFPGISISTVSAANFDLSSLGGVGLSKNQAVLNTITIPEAYTYGVAEGEALAALQIWCLSDGNQRACMDGPIRRLLGAVYGDYVNTKYIESEYRTKGVYPLKIILKIITRVYLTREVKAASSASIVHRGSQVSSEPGSPKDGRSEGAGAKGSDESRDDIALAAHNGALDLDHRYPMPVVFGYKSVSLVLGCTFPAIRDTKPCDQ